MDIKQIENELQTLLQADKANWIRIYELMEEVDRENLWKGIERSFTAWVRNLSNRIGVHESLLWSRKKAGGIYAEYVQRANERGEEPVPMTELNVSPDSLVFCEKIARGNNQIKDDLIEKTVKGDLKRSDLKHAWAARKAEIESKGMKATKSNSYDKLPPETPSKASEGLKKPITQASNVPKLTAADIVLDLNRPDWIRDQIRKNHPEKQLPSYKKLVYRAIPEFPVRTGTSRHARRIDLLLIENYTLDVDDMVALHGIEIKVSRSDLLNDHKSSEYADYVDVMWFAVPENLAEDAVSVAGDGWGILAIDAKRNVKIVKTPKTHNPVHRNKTLNMVLLKIL